MKILIVEDDQFVAEVLATVLSNQNYAVEVAHDGEAAWDLIQTFDYDLILLDVLLPKLDGITLCRQIRGSGLLVPILLLTGRDSSHDKAVGLDAGGDDYLVKPFDEEELVARIRALLRRGGVTSQPVMQWGDLQFDPISCEVTYDKQLLPLTPKEYALLELFLRNSRRVFSCGMILEHLWSYEDTPGEEAVRTHIKGLRHKLKSAGASSDLIETVYGIGYRLKPQQEEGKKGKQRKQETSSQQQTIAAIAKVWQRFQGRVREQVRVIEQAALALTQQDLNGELHSRALQEAHTLAGSLGTFGFPNGSRLARNIEILLKAGRNLTAIEIEDLQNWVTQLCQEVEQNSEKEVSLVPVAGEEQGEQPLLLMVDRDRILCQKITKEAAIWGFKVITTTSIESARHLLYQEHPSVVLLDPSVTPSWQDSLGLLAELNQRQPLVPTIVFTIETDLANRLQVARNGAQAFLQKPISAVQVLETVTQVLQQAEHSETNILAVDDDPKILALLQTLLVPWGMRVQTLDNPLKFWEKLEALSPDLLILDVEMPGINGVEICQAVRNDPRWGDLPILFLTVHNEADIVNRVFSVGADDYVSKPIVGPELVTRIINRLDRIKLLRTLAQTDGLTKVPNRHKSTQDLEKLVQLCLLNNQPLCLAILDLDYFKQLNDRYGYATGDVILRQVGQMLQKSFSREDAIGRWGGQEFVIGMYGMTKNDSIQKLYNLLENLQKHQFIAPEHSNLQVTFSAGVAQYPEDGTDLQSLYRSADAALSQAKKAGGMCIFSAGAIESEKHVAKH
jgi:diguanylate cyclase (GGDEF)-like protein